MTKSKKYLIGAIGLMVLAIISTVVVVTVDVQPIGPAGSAVGLATLNDFIFKLFGVNWGWYQLTDWLGIIAILVAVGFGVLGLVQVITRKNLKKVDPDLIALGGLYAAVGGWYVFFEKFIINYRPILIDGQLEASYPSSHTMLVCVIMGAALIQIARRISPGWVRTLLQIGASLVIGLTVAGRLLSGVHWFSDIIGGLLISVTLLTFYRAALSAIDEK